MKNYNRNTDSEEFKKGKAALGKLGMIILNFALIFALFRFLLSLSVKLNAAWIYYATTTVYALAAIVLFIAFFVLNGYTFGKEPRGEDELPVKWSDEKKAQFLESQAENRKKAKKLIYFILPLVLTMIISYIELNFFG